MSVFLVERKKIGQSNFLFSYKFQRLFLNNDRQTKKCSFEVYNFEISGPDGLYRSPALICSIFNHCDLAWK